MSANEESKEQPPAICYSTSNAEEIPLASQPRPPTNLQDLLRYSTEAANVLGERSSSSSSSSYAPMDEESKKFLEEALKSMTVDVVQELLKAIRVLQNAASIPENGDTTDYELALDEIFDYVDNVDVANDFHKIGGFCVFKPCLESPHSALRWRGAELVAELCQNNPYCQQKVLEIGLMPCLLKMIDFDVDNTVQVKALYAVSCLVRDSEEGLQEFINCDGFSVLLRALQTDLEKLNIKSAFLLTSLCRWKPEIKDDLINMGYVEQLITQLSVRIQMLDEGHPPSLEHILNALLDIVENDIKAQEICRKPELQFKSLLDYVVKNSEENDQYKEENEYAKTLIKTVFDVSDNSDEER